MAGPKLHIISCPSESVGPEAIPARLRQHDIEVHGSLKTVPSCRPGDRVAFVGNTLSSDAAIEFSRRRDAGVTGVEWLSAGDRRNEPVASPRRWSPAAILLPDIVLDHPAEGWRVFDARTADEHIRTALMSERFGILYLHCHGSGFDLKLGTRLAGCGRSRMRRGFDASLTARAPACVSSGRCFRLDAPLDALANHEAFVDLADIEAEILVLDSCFAFSGKGGMTAPNFHALQALLHSGRNGCIVAHAGLPETDFAAYAALHERLADGVPVGEAVRETLNKASDAATPSLVFGDATMRLKQDRPRSFPHRTAQPDPVRQDILRLAGHRALVVAVASDRPRALVAEALRAVTLCESAAIKRSSDRPARLHDLHLAMCALIRPDEAHLFPFWKRTSERHATISRPCPACGAAAQVEQHAVVGVHEDGGRELLFCAQCGPLLDVPVSWEAQLFRDDDGFRVSFERDQRQSWFGMIAVAGDRPGEALAARWPAGADGRPAVRLRAPALAVTGRRRFAGVLFSGFDFGIFSSFLPERGPTSADDGAAAQ